MGAAHGGGSYERSYWEIVARQFARNRRAVWGARVVVGLILIAIFAPILANQRPLVFHGYRYKLYVNTWDQLVLAHGDLLGLGQSGPVKIPGLFPDGIQLDGVAQSFARDDALWQQANPTWRMIQNTSFGAAEEPMNELRGKLEESIKGLREDREWARRARDVAWLKEQKLPQDLVLKLDHLVELCRANVPEAARAKAHLRREAIFQQLRIMRLELNDRGQERIDELWEAYDALPLDFYRTADAAQLQAWDDRVLMARNDLSPTKVAFESHTDFPALRQLGVLDIIFMGIVLLWISRRLWSAILGWSWLGPVTRTRRQVVTSLLLPVLAAGVWTLALPTYNDTTDYQGGMHDGSLHCTFRVLAPLRYGVNQNDTRAKYQPPWWYESPDDGGQNTARRPSGDSELDAGLDQLQADVAALKRASKPGGYYGFLDWLNRHHMGTDGTGRDLLARMIWGSRISLSIGFVAVGIYVVIGVVLGALAGFFMGRVDTVISRVIEIVICFPTFFLILTVIGFLGPSIFNIMLIIGLTGWTGVARLVRGEFLRLRSMDFVIAGQALGFSDARVIFRHVLPNALAPVLVAATFGVASAILIESSLSFLGFGVTVPTPTWGSILSSARESWIYWWLTTFPGAAIFLTVTMYNLVGEGLRDAVDPKLRQ